MEGEMDRRESLRRVCWPVAPALLLASGLWGSCGYSKYKAVTADGVRCEVPRDWEYLPGGDVLLLVRSREFVNGVPAFVSVHPDQLRDRANISRFMEYERRLYTADPNFSQEELRRIPVGGTDGWLVAGTRSQNGPIFHPSAAEGKGPVKVREADIYFTVGGKGYGAAFGAPAELFEKYRPAFDHFLATLRVSQ